MRVPGELVDAVREAGSILVASHSPMDGDGLGSGLALLRALEGLGKRVCLVTEKPIPRAYSFLPRYDEIRLLAEGDPVPPCDLVLGLDAGEADRLGRAFRERSPGTKTANVDHHVSNEGYADINWVEPGAGATGEQVFALLKELEAEIDGETALCLLIALVTDTGRFCYSSTSAETLEAAAELVRHGADPDVLQRRLYGAVPLEVLHLRARAIANLRFHGGGAVCTLTVPYGFGRDLGVDEEDVKDLVDIVIGVRGVVVGALVRGLEDGTTKVSLRSKSDRADVAELAGRLGGGGHRRAAGFSAPGDPEATASRILPDLEALAVAASG